MLIAILAGLASAALIVVLARQLRAESWLYSLALPALPGLYAGFALSAGDVAAAERDLLLGLPYLIVGLVGTVLHGRTMAFWVALLWLLHGGIDALHAGAATPGVPPWYPAYCAAVDLALGAYLLRRLRTLSTPGS